MATKKIWNNSAIFVTKTRIKYFLAIKQFFSFCFYIEEKITICSSTTKNSLVNAKSYVPAPGIEPGPAGWEPAILTPRPCRITYGLEEKHSIDSTVYTTISWPSFWFHHITKNPISIYEFVKTVALCLFKMNVYSCPHSSHLILWCVLRLCTFNLDFVP